MSTTTTRLGMVKPAGTENYDITIFDANFDKTDAAVGQLVVTSSTRPSSPFSGQTIYETDTGNTLIWDGTGWSHRGVPNVTATSSILRPYNGQTILNTTDNTYYRRIAGAWVPILPGAGTTSFFDTKYGATTAQVVTTSTNTNVALPTDVRASTLVTKAAAGAGHQFTLNRAGLWQVALTIRFQGATGGSERYIEVLANGVVQAGQACEIPTATGAVTMTVSFQEQFASGDILIPRVWQSSGGNVSTDPTTGWTNLRLSWMHG